MSRLLTQLAAAVALTAVAHTWVVAFMAVVRLLVVFTGAVDAFPVLESAAFKVARVFMAVNFTAIASALVRV
jgi:hypothetical protein